MITIEEANVIVESEIASFPDLENDKLIVLHEETITKEWGWVYFYTSEKWMLTGDIQYALAGNAPLIVEKSTGRILSTGTAQRIEHYIERYEITGDPNA